MEAKWNSKCDTALCAERDRGVLRLRTLAMVQELAYETIWATSAPPKRLDLMVLWKIGKMFQEKNLKENSARNHSAFRQF